MNNLSEINQESNSISPGENSISSSPHSKPARRIPTRSRPWSRRNKLLMLSILVLVFVDFFTALLLGIQVYSLSRQNHYLRANLARAEDDLQQMKPELEKLQVNMDELIRGKLPGLNKLVYDQVLHLNQAYLKNIIFTEIINRDQRDHEYKLVVQNNTSALLWPEIQILVFNKLGIQVGKSEIGTPQPNALKAGSLGVGEVRSYSAAIQLVDKHAIPAYFIVRILEEAK